MLAFVSAALIFVCQLLVVRGGGSTWLRPDEVAVENVGALHEGLEVQNSVAAGKLRGSSEAPSLLGSTALAGWPGGVSVGFPQVQGPSLLASAALVVPLLLGVSWAYQRSRALKFDLEPEVTLQRKLFDDSTGLRTLLRNYVFTVLQWAAIAGSAAAATLLLLRYVSSSYVMIAAFVIIALVYDRDQVKVMKDGEKRLGIDETSF
mmetsp:Transcript_87572/g.165046  ORF Transcript_87572/g.165046 Transcript_87572/m.165046 type:complete len:205 (-) Transcript_87572:48-662(-)